MNVLKFGGTSVGTDERIKHVARLTVARGRNLIVLSAMAGTTNALVAICDAVDAGSEGVAVEMAGTLREHYIGVARALVAGAWLDKAIEAVNGVFDTIHSALLSERDATVRRRLVTAQGELLSTRLMVAYMRSTGVNAVLIDALDVMRLDASGEPDTAFLARRLGEAIEAAGDADIYITQGFICRDSEGRVATLTRGGSDFTATLMGAAVNAGTVEIWTDIDGMHDNDPRVVAETHRVDALSYDEAAALAFYGAKILHPQCVLPARDKGIPVRLLNTMQPDAQGTTISAATEPGVPKAVAAREGVTTLRAMRPASISVAAFMAAVAGACADAGAAVDLMAGDTLGVTVAVDATVTDVEALSSRIEAVTGHAPIAEADGCVVCVAGERLGAAVLARVAEALGDDCILPAVLTASGAGVCAVVKAESKPAALQRLSDVLFCK